MPELTREYLAEQYVSRERSIHDIAAECGTYPLKVYRALLKHGIKPRNHSEAQKVAIKSGRHPHPTKGTERPEETRTLISESLSKRKVK